MENLALQNKSSGQCLDPVPPTQTKPSFDSIYLASDLIRCSSNAFIVYIYFFLLTLIFIKTVGVFIATSFRF